MLFDAFGNKNAKTTSTSSTGREKRDLSNASSAATTEPSDDGHRRLSRKERRYAKRELRRQQREVDARARGRRKSLAQLARENERGLSQRFRSQRSARSSARDVYNAIGFDYMFEDGTCQVEEGLFSQSIAFTDINYQSRRDEDQTVLFNIWSQIFNYCGSDTTLQLSIANRPLPASEIGHRTFFPEDDPRTAEYAREYNQILNKKMLDGVSNLVRHRCLTFSVSAESYARALPELAGLRDQITESLRNLGCTSHQMTGAERIDAIAAVTRPGGALPFSYDDLWTSGLTAKDHVCPMSLDFASESTVYKSDSTWCQALVFRRFGSDLTDRSISELADLPIPLNISLHVQPIAKSRAIDIVREKNDAIDADIIRNQRKAVDQGFDYNLLPPELSYSKADGKELLDQLLYSGQNLYLFTGVVLVYADDRDELQNRALRMVSAARKNGIEIEELSCQQREGMNSVIPVGNNHVQTQRYLTTAQVAMMVPFATQELSDEGGGYYGQNKLSSNLIMLNRGKLPNPMGFEFGQPGSGKSFATKREITNNYLSNPSDEFLIIDPNSEYIPLVDAFGGAVVQMSPDSPDHINLFDIYAGAYDATTKNPVSIKASSILAIAESVLDPKGLRGGLAPIEKSIIDRAVRETYERFQSSPVPPTLGDFYETLLDQEEPEAARLAQAFELYVTGSLSYFNHQSTVDVERRITCFSFKQLGPDMQTFAMLVILDYVYNRMFYNSARGVRTWVYIDEVQSLFQSGEAVFGTINRLWSEGRKYNLIATGISQLPQQIIEHPDAKNLFDNSGFLLLLTQSDRNCASIARLMDLSPQQKSFIDKTNKPGEGLLMARGVLVPFKDDFPKGRLYDLWNTKPDETAAAKRAEWQRKMEARDRAAAEEDEGASAGDAGTTEDAGRRYSDEELRALAERYLDEED